MSPQFGSPGSTLGTFPLSIAVGNFTLCATAYMFAVAMLLMACQVWLKPYYFGLYAHFDAPVPVSQT